MTTGMFSYRGKLLSIFIIGLFMQCAFYAIAHANVTPAFVQSVTAARDTYGSSLTTNAINTTSGHLFVVVVSWDSAYINMSVSDNKGNTYVAATSKQVDNRHNQSMQLFYVADGNGGASHTFTATPSSSAAWMRIAVHEVSGIDTLNPLDQTVVINNEAGVPVTVGPRTTTMNAEYVFAAAMNDSGSNTFDPAVGSGFTERSTASPGSSEMQTQDTIQDIAGPVSSTWTMSGTNHAMAQMATFRPDVSAPDTIPPSVPTNVSANSISASQIDLSWTASTDNISVAGYNVFRDGIQISSTTAVSYQDVGLSASTTYTYTVSAFDAAQNESAQSASSSATTQAPDTVAPSVPVDLQASNVTSSSVTLSWSLSTDNVGVTGYSVFRDGDQIGTTTGANYIDTLLAASTTYTYTVSAFDAAQNVSGQSAPLATTTSEGLFAGPLRVSQQNSRYFTDDSGKAIYLTGSHTWSNFVDNGYNDPPTPFDYTDYLAMLEGNHHNLIRLWVGWEQARGMTFTSNSNYFFDPSPFKRTGPGVALDGKPKFDVTQFNQAFFDRLRQRVIEAGEKGMYVSILLFNGWSLEDKGYPGNPWLGHPFNANNNINGINGDPNGDNAGIESHTLADPSITAIQEAYLRKVIDSVNDLDNVLYEITNEDTGSSEDIAWQYHMINYIKSYEMGKTEQHPVGMSMLYPNSDDSALFDGPADWVSPNSKNVTDSDGSKVVMSDTDHGFGAIQGDRKWVWERFMGGLNVQFMDTYGSNDYAATAHPNLNPNDPVTVNVRQNMGYVLDYSKKIDLNLATPQANLFSTGYGLAYTSATDGAYLGYLPNGGSIAINLTATPGQLDVEWLNPATGVITTTAPVTGGGSRVLTAPFSGDAVVYLMAVPTEPDTTPPTTPTNVSANSISASQIDLSWTASTDNISVAGYNVFRDGIQISSTTAVSYQDTGLTQQTLYTYTIKAYDAAGNVSSSSSPVSTTTLALDTTPPSVPQNVSASALVPGQIDLSWDASVDDSGTVAGYIIFRDGVQEATSTTTMFTDTSLAASTTYSYTVAAVDASFNTSAQSSAASTTTLPMTQGLVIGLSFNEGSGASAADTSGNNNNGTLINSPSHVAGKYGNALSFNGNNQRVDVPDSLSLRLTTGMTLMAWVNPSVSNNQWKDIIMKGVDNYYLEGLSTNGGRPAVGGTFTSALYGSASLPANTWSHLAATYDGSTLRLYINGIQVASRAQSGNIQTSSMPLGIGGDSHWGQYFQGLIDEVRIYDHALTQSEIQSDMNIGL